MNWTLKFLPEAQKDFEQLAGNQKLLVAKALDKVVQNPVSIYEGGYGKPLGSKSGTDLSGLLKIKLRDAEIFAGIPALYVADGHHRTAAAARVGKKRQESNPNHTGNEEYCYFLAVTFPASQLRIIDYNRVVKDLNGMTTEQFLKALEKNFTVEPKGKEIYHPSKLHNFSLYLDGQWYSLTAKPGTYDDNDPIGVLDVTVLSNLVLDQLLDIKDLRTSKRIDFVGGIRGLEELKKRVDSGEMKAAFALYPVSMQQLIDIADTDRKSTRLNSSHRT